MVALDHAGLSVEDLDRAIGFYGRAFGFESEFAFDLPHEIRGVMMRLPSGGRLELFARPDSSGGLRAEPGPVRASDAKTAAWRATRPASPAVAAGSRRCRRAA